MAKNRGGKQARENRKAKRANKNGETSASDQTTRSVVDPYRTHGPAAIGAAVAGQGQPPKPQGDSKAAKATAKPPSVSENNPDRQRELQREQHALSKFPSPELSKADQERREAQSKSAARESSKGRAKSLDEVQKAEGKVQNFGQSTAVGQIDHATLNHPRSEHEHRVGSASATVEGPAPRRVDTIKDEAVILEQLRLETKADNLYLMRRQERESDNPREHVIDAINARLVEVQGAPILPE